jgi:hypothetical protein
MTKAQKPCLVAAVALLSVILTPRSSQGGTISGSWTEAESYSVVLFTDGRVTGGYGASRVPTVLTIVYDTDSEAGSITLMPTSTSYQGFGWAQSEFSASFGATSGSAHIFGGVDVEANGSFPLSTKG